MPHSKHARIVLQLCGPVRRLHLRHVPSNDVVSYAGVGPDLAASIEELRSKARCQGYNVDDGHTVEDWRLETVKEARYGEPGREMVIDGFRVRVFGDRPAGRASLVDHIGGTCQLRVL